jgi:hypothetical protein
MSKSNIFKMTKSLLNYNTINQNLRNLAFQITPIMKNYSTSVNRIISYISQSSFGNEAPRLSTVGHDYQG